MFLEQMEEEAITRIQKFSKIALAMGFEVCVGFSGGKDSQVVYDLCLRSGIKFKAYFNHSFESNVTLKFIKENYPDVIKRRDYPYGFIENVWKGHNGLLPTVSMPYCCQDYKHNSKYVDKCSIVGVRWEESNRRRQRKVFESKNTTTRKKNKQIFNNYFEENCQAVGTSSVIQLKPVLDWRCVEIWEYIYKYKLPINPEYKRKRRVGCIICPKADFTRNADTLIENPKLIDVLINARTKCDDIDWIIASEYLDCNNDKCYYICRWLNHSFMPFTKKQEILYQRVKEKYIECHEKDKINVI